MKGLVVNGTQEFMGMIIPVIEGGFGEGKRCILVKDISLLHHIEPKVINQSIKRLIEKNRIKDNIHYIDLLSKDFEVTGGDLEIKTSNGQKNSYLLSERGYSSLIKYMDDDKSWEVHDQLIDHYFTLREKVNTALTKSEIAILNIVKAKNDVELALAIKGYEDVVTEPLKLELDRYSRFLCDSLSTLTKSELATKLDTKPQTLAALFKKLKIYTPKTSQVNLEFLKKFGSIKMIKEVQHTYTDPRSGIEKTKNDWQWTGEGAKIVVDYLIELGKVTFCENKGFKLVS